MNDENILEILRSINSRLDSIEDILYNTQKSTRKMDNHIDFIDNVYDNVRKPFSKILTFYSGNTVTIEKKSIDDDK
jgi:hypothetical protein